MNGTIVINSEATNTGVSSPTSIGSIALQRFFLLDIIRCLCALSVFLSHWFVWCDFAPRHGAETIMKKSFDFLYDIFNVMFWSTHGHHPAVLCFFVLSGFCIHYSVARTQDIPKWSVYYERRLRRIGPVYLAGCVLGMTFVIAHTLYPTTNEFLIAQSTAKPTDIIGRFLGISGLIPHEIFAGNSILLTVATEMLLYAVYPLFYAISLRKNGWWTLAIVSIILYLSTIPLVSAGMNVVWIFNSFLMLGIFWWMGAFVAHLAINQAWKPKVSVALLAYLLFLFSKYLPAFRGATMIRQIAFGAFCSIALLLAIAWERRGFVKPNDPLRKLMRRCADIGYSLYAVHTPMIMLSIWAMLAIFGIRSYPMQFSLTFTTSVLCSVGVYFGIERRFYRSKVV